MKDASYRPTSADAQHLMQILSLPGYQVLEKIMVGEIDQFTVDLLNVDPDDGDYEKKVRNRHNLALSAGMFYERLRQKIAGYVNRTKEASESPILPDQTEEMFQ